MNATPKVDGNEPRREPPNPYPARSRCAHMPPVHEPSFWACATAWDGAITRLVAPDVLIIGLVAFGWVLLYGVYPDIHLRVGPVEIAGGAMGLMLVFRNNGGYERWWEGRRLWGQITNNVRTLVQAGLAYGPKDAAWRQTWVRWCAAFPHACRLSLRGHYPQADVVELLGPERAEQLSRAAHLPSFVAYRLAAMLAEAAKTPGVAPSFLINMEAARASLVDAIGACERIAATPLPRLYVYKIRRFMALYLLLLPAALVDRVGWVTPFLTMLVAYSALGLDRIAQELQTPFDPRRLNHLPLEAMCRAIQANSMRVLAAVEAEEATQPQLSEAAPR